MGSTRSTLPEDLRRIDQVTGGNIGVRRPEGVVKGRAVSFIEPITGIQRQELNLGTLGQLRWFVEDQPAGVNLCLDGPAEETCHCPGRPTN
ncbi:MAG: hypothetical protein E2P06_06890 [Acidobacteria bacterium]|nr:MAG: hypothetical protein E2P06_06890 [Acidobacteriota bacterium]